MKITKTISAWVRAKRDQHRVRRMERKMALLRYDAQRMVQVREFDSQLFVCYNDEPIVPVDRLKGDTFDVLSVAREAYVKYNQSHKLL